MNQPMTLTPALVLAVLLSAGVIQAAQAQAPSSGVKTIEKSGVTAQGDTAATMTITTATATVEAIDLATRMVTLIGPEGKGFILQAGEQVRNLAQVRVGDKVTVEYYEGLVAEMDTAGASPDKVKVTTGMTRAAPGTRPAGAMGDAVSATVVIEYVDTLRNVVHFKGPQGKTRVVKVMKPEFRTMLKKLKVGDQVKLTYFEALAVSVKPAGK